MTTPMGCLQSLTPAWKRLARKGDVEGLRAYVRSDAFLRAFNGLDPNRRQSAMRSYANAEAFCEAKTRHPLVKPGTIDARRAQKANLSGPAMRVKIGGSGEHEAPPRISVRFQRHFCRDRNDRPEPL